MQTCTPTSVFFCKKFRKCSVVICSDDVYVICTIGSIQSAWRGYVVRCWYHTIRQTNPPTHPHLRRQFYQEKVCHCIQSVPSFVQNVVFEICVHRQTYCTDTLISNFQYSAVGSLHPCGAKEEKVHLRCFIVVLDGITSIRTSLCTVY